MSLGQIIDYFRNGLRNGLKRPNCGRPLWLWDKECWQKANINAHFLINTNEFLMFWYQTSFELCCVENQAGLNLRN